MTLNDIIVAALGQLDRGHDSQTLDTWRDKFTHFANEAAADLAHTLSLKRTDAAEVAEGILDINTLPRGCYKIVSVSRNGKEVPFLMGMGSNIVRVKATDGPVDVKYVYAPKTMAAPTDVPEVPALCHGLIVTYIVGRERAAGDVSTQRGANVYFDLYRAGKLRLRHDLAEDDAFAFQNRW